MRVLGPTIRSRLLLLLLAATLPLLAFSALLLNHAYHVSGVLIEQTALSQARRVAAVVDAQIGRAEAIGYAFAEMPLGDLADPAAFETAAIHVLTTAKLDGAVQVIDGEGMILATTRRNGRRQLGANENLDVVRRVFASATPQIAGLYIGAVSHLAQVAVHVPYVENGQVRYDIAVVTTARSIGVEAGPSVLPDNWFTVVVDQKGSVISDTSAAASKAGDDLPPAAAPLIERPGDGFGSVAYRGQQVLLGHTHAARTGWVVAAGVPESLVRAPMLRSIGALAAAGAAVLAAGLGLAWLIGRSIVGPLAVLARQAGGVEPRPVDQRAWRGLAEIEAVARALQEASDIVLGREARLEGEAADRRRKLEASEQRFRIYFEYSSDALIVARVDGDDFVYEMINKATERLFGLTPEQIIGRRPEDVFAPETAYAQEAAYRRAIHQSGEKITVQRSLAFPSGTLHIETILIAVGDPDDAGIVRIISGSRDLTERQRLEGRLQHAQRLEAIGQLTGGVAHDFNNLLTVVIGNLSLLRRRLQDDERSVRYLASVEAAAQRGAKLTASLLAFSRRQTLNVEQLDVAARIAESATLLQRALGEEIEFELAVDGDIPAANADSAQLEAAVLNLVINARDAIADAMAPGGRRGGRLRITVRQALLEPADLMGNEEARPGAFVAILVADTGIGMTPAVRARAFEPFFTTKEIGHGTGLGLSQVFGFVRQLGGHVTIESTPGEGTTVGIFLPAALTAALHPPVEAPEPNAMPGGATVLVVEDDASIREIIAEMLRDVELRVLIAANGPQALDLLRSGERIDLLFSDVVMPGGATGVDLARAARELRPELPVLLTSGYAGAALSRYGPVSEFIILLKPYTRAALLERVGALLASVPVPS